MSTSKEQPQDSHPGNRLDPFHEPQTVPAGWDLSELTSPARHESGNGHQGESSTANPVETMSEVTEEADPSDVSFSDWHLSQHLDHFDNPGSSHFSAF